MEEKDQCRVGTGRQRDGDMHVTTNELEENRRFLDDIHIFVLTLANWFQMNWRRKFLDDFLN